MISAQLKLNINHLAFYGRSWSQSQWEMTVYNVVQTTISFPDVTIHQAQQIKSMAIKI